MNYERLTTRRYTSETKLNSLDDQELSQSKRVRTLSESVTYQKQAYKPAAPVEDEYVCGEDDLLKIDSNYNDAIEEVN